MIQNGEFIPTLDDEILQQWCVEDGFAIEFYAQVTNTGTETELELKLQKEYDGSEVIVARALSDINTPE